MVVVTARPENSEKESKNGETEEKNEKNKKKISKRNFDHISVIGVIPPISGFSPPFFGFLPPFFYIGDSLKIESELVNYQYSKQKKEGKKLVERGKKLLHFLEEDLSFNLHQELAS